MDTLPIYAIVEELRQALQKRSTVILQAPPGAGKSTVLPLQLLNEKWLQGKKIIMLEPRRLAAKAVAHRLAEHLGELPGKTVGYRIRFEQKISKDTRIEIVTEGILTRMLQRDNALEDYGLVIFDEFHERSLHADLALALCRESQAVLRKDLRLLIMSATLDSEKLLSALPGTPLIISEGRQYPIRYAYHDVEGTEPIWKNTCKVIRKAMREESGDLLVFLPGSGDIHRAKEMLEETGADALVLALYGDLPLQEQQRALQPDPNGRRKIVLSTSIAETSLTIEGIRIVVDCGYSRVPRFDPSSGLTHLETVRSSIDTADQRAGRAGRLGPGVCYRMWSAATTHHMAAQRNPEILQADLSPLVLELAGWGNCTPENLHWITLPPTGAVQQAKQLLEELGALSENKLTPSGRRLLDFPAHPRIAHLLSAGKDQGWSALACDVAAALEEKDPLPRDAGADLLLRLEALVQWRNKERVNASHTTLERMERISMQWRKVLDCAALKVLPDPYVVGELVVAAYPERIARKEGDSCRYRLANGVAARLPPHDPLQHADWIVISQLDAGTTEGKIFLATVFDPSTWIEKITPVESIAWNYSTNTVQARNEWRIGKLIVKEAPMNSPDKNKTAAVIATYISKEGLHLFDRTTESDQLQARVVSLKKWNPDFDLPDFSDDCLLQTIRQWGAPFLGEIKKKEDLKKLDFKAMLLSYLDWNQLQHVNQLAPEKLEVPSGSLVRLDYTQEGRSPVLAVRLQEVFGWKETPRINNGSLPVVMHLLSPGYKPVQVTTDLHSFWEKTYHDVRKELRIRYPKHSWPENPWTAMAIRGAVRRKS
jgi:ATP-dependent helicase HrpB